MFKSKKLLNIVNELERDIRSINKLLCEIYDVLGHDVTLHPYRGSILNVERKDKPIENWTVSDYFDVSCKKNDTSVEPFADVYTHTYICRKCGYKFNSDAFLSKSFVKKQEEANKKEVDHIIRYHINKEVQNERNM